MMTLTRILLTGFLAWEFPLVTVHCFLVDIDWCIVYPLYKIQLFSECRIVDHPD